MPNNVRMEGCIRDERGALVFCAPGSPKGRLTTKSHIIDVFSLEVATGYKRDQKGRLILQAQPFIEEGRTWAIVKAAQLIRNEKRPKRWVALEKNKRAWGLFWAGGGVQRCRELLADGQSEASALVPVTADAILRLFLSLEDEDPQDDNQAPNNSQRGPEKQINLDIDNGLGRSETSEREIALDMEERVTPEEILDEEFSSDRTSTSRSQYSPPNEGRIWKTVLWSSLAWLVALGGISTGFLISLEQKERVLQIVEVQKNELVERTNQLESRLRSQQKMYLQLLLKNPKIDEASDKEIDPSNESKDLEN